MNFTGGDAPGHMTPPSDAAVRATGSPLTHAWKNVSEKHRGTPLAVTITHTHTRLKSLCSSKGRFTPDAMRIADERCFHTERETIDCLLLFHACTLGGANQQCVFPQMRISYIDLTSSTAQYTNIFIM